MDKPAFPAVTHGIRDGNVYKRESGMTLREYAAVAAMQGLLANGEMIDSGDAAKWVADTAVSHADALLARLEGKP